MEQQFYEQIKHILLQNVVQKCCERTPREPDVTEARTLLWRTPCVHPKSAD